MSSTNDAARGLAEDGAPHATVVVAREQTAGRGRLGRTWQSPRDAGLYASFVARPFAMEEASHLALRSAIAAARSLERLAVPARIKWPNDLLIGDRKVGGILVEARSGYAIVGIGINILASANPLLRENPKRFTALDLEGVRTEPEVLLDALVQEFDRLVPHTKELALTDDLLEEWARRDALAGRRIACTMGGREFEGVALGVDTHGRLRVRRDDGEVTVVAAAEVSALAAVAT